MIGNVNALQQSKVKGSSVWSDIKDELVKKGQMYIVQKVFREIAVGSSETSPHYFTFLFELDAINADYLVLYDLKYQVNKGQAIATFYGQGGYTTGTVFALNNRNENSSNVAKMVASYRDDGTTQFATPGTEGQSYLAGTPGTGTVATGGATPGEDLPTEVNKSVNRILQFEQAGGTGTFNLEFRAVFAEIYL